MKVLVTGAAGMLGSCLVKKLQEFNQVIQTEAPGVNSKFVSMDIRDADKVMRVIEEWQPDYVYHCAAMTNVDACEDSPIDAFLTNTVGTLHVARACNRVGATMVYISTDYVFGGDNFFGGVGYAYNCKTDPINAYGHSKLAGELLVRTYCGKHYIVRTSWLFSEHGKNFPNTILNKAELGGELKVVSDQIGSPTYVPDLADYLVLLISNDTYFGTYHFTNSGHCSWYDFARTILDKAGMTDIHIAAISSEELTNSAKRPKYSVLNCWPVQSANWADGVDRYIKARKELLSKQERQ